MTRTGIYLRISDDRDGTQTATERQRHDCIRFAESRGWEVVDVFEDIDLSAYKRRVKRPEFERMLTAVREKKIDRVLAWKVDRLTRRMRDIVRLDDACEEVGAYISTVVESIDTQQPTGRFVLELLVAQARMESENASIRITRKEAERATQGFPQIGGYRLFGYNQKRTEIIPEEAALIREARDRVFAGDSILGICWDWKARGVTSVRGGAFSKTVLRNLLLRPSIAGFREHGGRLFKGKWEGIISEEDHRRLVAILTDPSRTTRLTSRSYLLTGLLICGECGELLVGRPRADKQSRYVCNRQPESRACGTVTRLAAPVDEMVKEAVIEMLGSEDLRAFVEEEEPDTTPLTDAIRADEASLEELQNDYYLQKEIDRSSFFRMRETLQARIKENRRQLAKVSSKSLLHEFVGAGDRVLAEWDERDIAWRKRLISSLIASITLERAVRGLNRFDHTKVRIEWRF